MPNIKHYSNYCWFLPSKKRWILLPAGQLGIEKKCWVIIFNTHAPIGLNITSKEHQSRSEGKFAEEVKPPARPVKVCLPDPFLERLDAYGILNDTGRSKESVEYRRKTGGNLGGRPKTSNKKESLVIRLRSERETYRSIQDQTGLALATINRIIKDIN